MKSLTISHKNLLSEGRKNRKTEAFLTKEIRVDEKSDDPGIIYLSPDLVVKTKDYKYGLGWDTSYKKCHRGLPPFAVPPMYIVHQQERKANQDRIGRATTTSIGYIKRGEGNPHSLLEYHMGLLQTLSRYIKLLTTVVDKKSIHLMLVVAIRKTITIRMDLYFDIE